VSVKVTTQANLDLQKLDLVHGNDGKTGNIDVGLVMKIVTTVVDRSVNESR
jgi:hypothetical protein